MATTRRSFLGALAAAAGAVAAAPQRLLGSSTAANARGVVAPRLPRDAAGLPIVPQGALGEEFWRALRGEFLIPDNEAFFNTGTLGSSPRVVLDAVIEHMTHVERDIAHWDYKPEHEQYFTGYFPETALREKLARLVGADADEIALTQNATFGMSFIANGLDFGAGDEVLIMENAHSGGRGGWELRGKRYGMHVRYVRPPIPPQTPAQLIAIFEQATTPQTRVWAIPHLTSGTAILFPVEELCRRARERGILSVIDGAQTCGHLALDLHAMGCDVFYSSPHKWLLSPVGTGFLYIRRDLLPRVWATLASGEWNNYDIAAYRLFQYGTGNLSLLVGFDRAIDFHQRIGSGRVQQRIVGLADRLRAGLHEIPGVVIGSPVHPELVTATTIWRIEGMTGTQTMDALWDRARIRVRSIGNEVVRQCCHVYTLTADVDRTLEEVRRLSAGAAG
ncbi:MAG: aminotransferase class V-fold PLP-dependent enzyme [Longimicrobiales bacterium]